jgi:hypothetical protein
MTIQYEAEPPGASELHGVNSDWRVRESPDLKHEVILRSEVIY